MIFDTLRQLTRDEQAMIDAIVDRAAKLHKKYVGGKFDRISLAMDLEATHAGDCPLRLGALLAADDVNFSHDVFGIRQHLNRTTGKLEHCFLPRFADLSAGGV